MTDIDLDELERLASTATRRNPTAVYMLATATDPQMVLALIERVKRAEAEVAFLKENRLTGLEADAAALEKAEVVIAEVKRLAELDVRCPCCTGYESILDTLATYQNGADQP